MEQQFKEYLESATVHGLVYITNTRRLVRLFWVCVVIFGFSAAFMLIYESFQSWAESPVSTTVDTLPITKLTFPKVTVCPPKNTFTNLNYDLMMLENMTIDNDTRKEMVNFVTELLHKNLHDSIKTKLNKMEDEDRYYNWYHGLTRIDIPRPPNGGGDRELLYRHLTKSESGSIKTKHFGEKFDAEKVDPDIQYDIELHSPLQVSCNDSLENITIQINVEKVTLEGLSTGKDQFYTNTGSCTMLHENVTHINSVCSPTQPVTASMYNVRIDRDTSMDSIRNVKIQMMPGMKITWQWDWDVEDYGYYDYYDYQNNYGGGNCRSFSEEYPLFSDRKLFVR